MTMRKKAFGEFNTAPGASVHSNDPVSEAFRRIEGGPWAPVRQAEAYIRLEGGGATLCAMLWRLRSIYLSRLDAPISTFRMLLKLSSRQIHAQ